MYVYTLHATISLHCKVMSVLSLFDDDLYPMLYLVMSYLQCINMFCSERTSFYVCIVHEYIVCESICAGAQKDDKGSCTHKRTADCCHNSVRRARDHGNLTSH